MTYFTLLYGDKLAAAPESKVLKADQFSKLVEGDELLQQIREETEKYWEEQKKKAKHIRAKAKEAGFQEGLELWNEHIAKLESETARVHDEVNAKVLPIVIKAAEAVVGRELSTNEKTIGDIVMKNLKSVADHKRIAIYCHKDDYEALQARRDEMKTMFERLENLVIQERDDVEPGGCIIETEAGIINAQWETQMRALEAALRRSLESS